MLEIIGWILVGVYVLGVIVFAIFGTLEFEDEKRSDKWISPFIWFVILIYAVVSVRKGKATYRRTK